MKELSGEEMDQMMDEVETGKPIDAINAAETVPAVETAKTPAATTQEQPAAAPGLETQTAPKAELLAQAASAPVAVPEVVIPAAVAAPSHVDDSFGQYRLVEKLSVSLQGGVLKGSETEVYLNLGQVHGVSEGTRFEIVRPGAPIRVGNEVIGHEETKIANVEATTVREKLSI